jgi:hypothetical protein
VQTTRPANCEHIATLVAVVIGNTQRVRETMIEFLEALC